MTDSGDNSMVGLWEIIGTGLLKTERRQYPGLHSDKYRAFGERYLVEMACSGIERSVNDILCRKRRN